MSEEKKVEVKETEAKKENVFKRGWKFCKKNWKVMLGAFGAGTLAGVVGDRLFGKFSKDDEPIAEENVEE